MRSFFGNDDMVISGLFVFRFSPKLKISGCIEKRYINSIEETFNYLRYFTFRSV